MHCWNCGAFLEDLVMKKLSFRETCDTCYAALHCCNNCIYHQIGRSNECMIPDTDRISDRTSNNFCEEFSVLGKAPASNKNDNAKLRFEKLFKE